MKTKYSSDRMKEKIFSKTRKVRYGCWIWEGSRSPSGYGVIFNGLKSAPAHRVSYEIFKGEIPEDKFVLHSCDNPPCIKPAHLRIGTHEDNAKDMSYRDRMNFRPYFRDPERHSHAKLDWEKVNKIRKLWNDGYHTCAELGREFGLGSGSVNAIVNMQTWRYRNKEEWIEAQKARRG